MWVSWAGPQTLHLTIKFLGEIEEGVAGRLRESIPGIDSRNGLSLPLDRLGAFPNGRAPRTLWIGPSDAPTARAAATRLVALHRAIDEACASVGLTPDAHPLSPHLTLARVRAGERVVGRALTDSGFFHRPLDAGSVACDAVTLFKSDLTATGPIHTRLWTLALRA